MRIAVDTAPLRSSHDLRLLLAGNLVTTLGAQATLVALPYQLYVETRSPALTGLLGAAELVPLVTMSLWGGALADRMDRRRLLLIVQLALAALSIALALLAFAGSPPLAALYVLGAFIAGFSSMQSVARSAIVPNVVPAHQMRQAMAIMYGSSQVSMVAGPALGGLLIAVWSVGGAYTVDAATTVLMLVTVTRLSPQPPHGHGEPHEHSILRSIAEGLRFVRGQRALLGSFAIDIAAMTFGMPRALFPVLSLTVYHAGAAGTGVLLASVSAGATIASLTTGWLGHARRLGRIVLWAVVAWGVAITLAGVVGSLWPAALMLALAGAADSVSAVCRSTINQTVTPDAMRGRMSSVFMLVVAGGPRVGDVESGGVASLASPRFSVVTGGIACVVAAFAIVAAFPALLAYDAQVAEDEMAAARGEERQLTV